MELRPLRSLMKPDYPPRARSRKSRILSWASRLGAAAGAALLLGGGAGCYGLAPYEEAPEPPGDPRPDLPVPDLVVGRLPWSPGPEPEPDPAPPPCEPDYRLSGAVAPTSVFACEPDPAPSFSAPIYMVAGETCGEAPAWARFEVPYAFRARVTIVPGAEDTELSVLDPAGETALELGPAASCDEVGLTPGIWTLRAALAGPADTPAGYFELYIDEVGEEE